MTSKTTVFHDIRENDRIFLCIATPDVRTVEDAAKASRIVYQCEREIPSDGTPETIRGLIKEMAAETGLSLEPSAILREMGV